MAFEDEMNAWVCFGRINQKTAPKRVSASWSERGKEQRKRAVGKMQGAVGRKDIRIEERTSNYRVIYEFLLSFKVQGAVIRDASFSNETNRFLV